MGYGELLLEFGYECNNNCRFCYAEQHRWRKKKSSQQFKKDLEKARERCDSVVIVGGEPTIRRDIISIVRYAKQLGYKNIFFESNGRMFYYEEFVKKIHEAGLKQPVVSIHSHKKELHDWLTRAEGSFEQVVQGVKNLQKYFPEVHTNTVITKQNYQDMPKIADFIINLGIKKADFLFMSPEGYGWKNFTRLAPKLTEIEPYVGPTIQKGINSKRCLIKMRYLPLCYIGSYDAYLSELVDRVHLNKEHWGPGFEYEDATERRDKEAMVKLEKCKDCKYDNVCAGVWVGYAKVYGKAELKPIKGSKVTARELLDKIPAFFYN
ncbi:MAG: radical SAM protein [Candidatus Nanoarchaeia archaeon]